MESGLPTERVIINVETGQLGLAEIASSLVAKHLATVPESTPDSSPV